MRDEPYKYQWQVRDFCRTSLQDYSSSLRSCSSGTQDEARRLSIPSRLLRGFGLLRTSVRDHPLSSHHADHSLQLFGYDLAVINEVVASDNFKTLFLQQSGDARSGTVVALFTAGCFTGALGSGFTAPIGRRTVIFMGASIFIVGGAIQTAGQTIGMLYAGRYIAGCGVGSVHPSDVYFRAPLRV